MPRRPRQDEPGREFHVMNRGSARRTIFDVREDYRFFLAQAARAVRRGEIRVVAYALMRTHYHLYVQSLGGLSEAIKRIQTLYSRRFNRMLKRDGPLFRGRFRSQIVADDTYRCNLVRYIHENPVLAGQAADATAYPWGSASALSRERPPIWLRGERVEALRRRLSGFPLADDAAAMRARQEFVEVRLLASWAPETSVMSSSTPAQMVALMRRKEFLADGARSQPPACGPHAMLAALRAHVDPDERVDNGASRSRPVLDVLGAGLLRLVAMRSLAETARLLGTTEGRVSRLCAQHLSCIATDAAYAARAERVIGAAIAPLLPA